MDRIGYLPAGGREMVVNLMNFTSRGAFADPLEDFGCIADKMRKVHPDCFTSIEIFFEDLIHECF
jgi:hypothetical protein